MKLAKANVYIFFTVLTILLFSCQSEENDVTQNDQENLVPGSELVLQLIRVTQYPTSADNIIDNSNCFSVNLPVVLKANGQQLIIFDEEDYVLIEDVFNESDTDEDVIEIDFPIIATRPDYSEFVISSQEEWDAARNCTGQDALRDLSCMRFNYPLSVNTYDVENQIADVVVISSKADFNGFLNTMQPEVHAAIAYPVRLLNPMGVQSSLNSNELLLSAINGYAEQCGE